MAGKAHISTCTTDPLQRLLHECSLALQVCLKRLGVGLTSQILSHKKGFVLICSITGMEFSLQKNSSIPLQRLILEAMKTELEYIQLKGQKRIL